MCILQGPTRTDTYVVCGFLDLSASHHLHCTLVCLYWFHLKCESLNVVPIEINTVIYSSAENHFATDSKNSMHDNTLFGTEHFLFNTTSYSI